MERGVPNGGPDKPRQDAVWGDADDLAAIGQLMANLRRSFIARLPHHALLAEEFLAVGVEVTGPLSPPLLMHPPPKRKPGNPDLGLNVIRHREQPRNAAVPASFSGHPDEHRPYRNCRTPHPRVSSCASPPRQPHTEWSRERYGIGVPPVAFRISPVM